MTDRIVGYNAWFDVFVMFLHLFQCCSYAVEVFRLCGDRGNSYGIHDSQECFADALHEETGDTTNDRTGQR